MTTAVAAREAPSVLADEVIVSADSHIMEPADLWDFDNEEEMRRRLPRLSALFLEPPD